MYKPAEKMQAESEAEDTVAENSAALITGTNQ